MQGQTEKQCPGCLSRKSVADFHRNRSMQDGLTAYCKICWNKMAAERRVRLGMKPRTPLPRIGRLYDVPDGHKYCPDCKTVNPISEFWPSKRQAGGLYPYCIPCDRIRCEVRRRAKGIPPRVDPSDEKRCPKCGEIKHLSEFSKNPNRARGINPYCFPCGRAYRREMAKKHGYHARATLAKKQKVYGRSKHVLACQIVILAVKLGVLVRQPCSVCGITERVQAHHTDYMKPLEVTWLCHLHHSHAHGKLLDQK